MAEDSAQYSNKRSAEEYKSYSGMEAYGMGASNGDPSVKRFALADGSERPSYSGTENVTVKALVNTKDCGSVIGKGGATIQSFREQTGTQITISQPFQSVAERILTVTGLVPGVGLAYALIASKMEASQNQQNEGSTGELDAPRKVTVNLLTPHMQAGALIGKNGAQIKLLRETTGANVSVAQDPLPGSNERLATVSGSADAVGRAIAEVARIFSQHPIKGQYIPYNPTARVDAMTEQYNAQALMGFQTGFGGAGVMGAYQQPQGNQAAVYQQTVSAGFPVTAAAAYTNYQQPIYPGLTPTARFEATQDFTQVIVIANELIGAIIGKGGTKINEIRRQSRAQIKVGDPKAGANEREVIVTGSQEACQTATYLINERLRGVEIHRRD